MIKDIIKKILISLKYRFPNEWSFDNSFYWELAHKKDAFTKIVKNETIVIGSSHGSYGFIPSVYGESSFNLCGSSQDLYYSKEILRWALKLNKNTKEVLLFFSVFSSGFALQFTNERLRTLAYKILFDINLKDKDNNLLSFIKLFTQKINKTKPQDCDYYDNGYTYPTFFMNNVDPEKRASIHYREFERIPNQLDQIQEILDICKSHNCHLTIVIPPARKDYRDYLPNNEQLTNKLKSFSDIHIISYYSDSDFLPSDFGDTDHLNTNGAIKLTNKLKKHQIN